MHMLPRTKRVVLHTKDILCLLQQYGNHTKIKDYKYITKEKNMWRIVLMRIWWRICIVRCLIFGCNTEITTIERRRPPGMQFLGYWYACTRCGSLKIER